LKDNLKSRPTGVLALQQAKNEGGEREQAANGNGYADMKRRKDQTLNASQEPNRTGCSSEDRCNGYADMKRSTPKKGDASDCQIQLNPTSGSAKVEEKITRSTTKQTTLRGLTEFTIMSPVEDRILRDICVEKKKYFVSRLPHLFISSDLTLNL